MSGRAYDLAVVIGRFQPLHDGHLALLQRALARAPRCALVLGSAHQARTPRAPLDDEERLALLRQALPAAAQGRVQLLTLRDHADPATWTRRLQRAVERRCGPGRVLLVGHLADATGTYQREIPGWDFDEVAAAPAVDAAALAEALYTDAPLPSTGLPACTQAFLAQWRATSPHRKALAEEWRQLRAYREAWSAAPYPPVFVTVDAVVTCAHHVLLIRRAHAPGRGLHAVPGGFIEQRETTWQSALRELAEETHLAVPAAELRQALRAQAVFDDPNRSQRGRTITHAFHFDLGTRPLPAVRADDDAQSVEWVPLAALRAIEDRFHDDHFLMLDHFLGLSGDGEDEAN